jgi:hypothetical protein
MALSAPTIPALPSSRELRELLSQRLLEAQELRALIRVAEARERALSRAEQRGTSAEAADRREVSGAE